MIAQHRVGGDAGLIQRTQEVRKQAHLRVQLIPVLVEEVAGNEYDLRALLQQAFHRSPYHSNVRQPYPYFQVCNERHLPPVSGGRQVRYLRHLCLAAKDEPWFD